MKYDFFANQINIGDDDAEEVYTVEFVDSGEQPGAPSNYLLLQRSVAGIGDPDLHEPYIEINDADNGRFADIVVSGELLPTYFHLVFRPATFIAADQNRPQMELNELVVRFDADGPLLRKLRYGLELVIGDGFAWQSLA